MNRTAQRYISIALLAGGTLILAEGARVWYNGMIGSQEMPYHERISAITALRQNIEDDLKSDPLAKIRMAVDNPEQRERYARLLGEYDSLGAEAESLQTLPEYRAVAENNSRQLGEFYKSFVLSVVSVIPLGVGYIVYPRNRRREEKAAERRCGHNVP